MNDFDLEKLERKNIYAVPENFFETVQENVINSVMPVKKAPIFKLNWAYAAAASLALIFGATFVFNNTNDSTAEQKYAVNEQKPKTESQMAYETLESDLTSVENNNQTVRNQENKKAVAANNDRAERVNDNENNKTVETVSTQKEGQMNEYLDSFSTSEISELASNSTQDVYLDVYN
ncbi:hypothetical protein ASG22_10770 [Chryseobacterium sp. Leaf405]|nr:hypothetical protein ASG22_10770 [Chryseobacterium sp. Leaf405]